jgi:hypothetical protein
MYFLRRPVKNFIYLLAINSGELRLRAYAISRLSVSGATNLRSIVKGHFHISQIWIRHCYNRLFFNNTLLRILLSLYPMGLLASLYQSQCIFEPPQAIVVRRHPSKQVPSVVDRQTLGEERRDDWVLPPERSLSYFFERRYKTGCKGLFASLDEWSIPIKWIGELENDPPVRKDSGNMVKLK